MTFERLASGPGGERTAAAAEVFGEGATAEETYGLLTVDVPAASWTAALTAARDVLGCTYFDWLSAVDEPGEGFLVMAHLVAVGTPVRHLLVRTRVPHDAPSLPTATGVYAGAAWHERETHEMFGVGFPGHPHLVPLLLPEGFEGHPLRKEFVLAARVAKAWPGAKEPGESEHGGPKRRQMLPPGVPDPNEWGPMKGKLAPEPARERPARGARAAGAARTGADRPRRTRTAGGGSVSQAPEGGAAPGSTGATTAPPGSARTGRTDRTGGTGRAGATAETAQTPERRAARPGRGGADAPWEQPRPAGEPRPAGRPRPTEEPRPEEPRSGSPGPAPDAPAPDSGEGGATGTSPGTGAATEEEGA